ncbi:hypothetical protein BKI52_30130 [marine bacterium AO1-C]|nr:hypothetical protein BKI52_30130 [marine bacterium AO1-C]
MKKLIKIMIVCLPLMMTACEEEKQESNKSLENKTNPALTAGESCQNAAGKWFIKELVDASGCDEGQKKVEINTLMKQTGCQAVLTIPGLESSIAFKGVVNGTQIYLKGTYQDSGTITKELFLTIEGQTLTGTAKWKYTDPTGLYSCKGTSKVNGQKR